MSHLLLSSLIKTLTKKKKNPKQNRHKEAFFPGYLLSHVGDNAPSAAAGRGSEYCSKHSECGALSAAVTCRVAPLCFKSSPSQAHGSNQQWYNSVPSPVSCQDL